MLLNFKVGNYRSINEPLILSMVPNEIKNPLHRIKASNVNAIKNRDYYALTSVAIYGPNASGKSNIIRALHEFKDFVRDSTESKPNELIKLHQPFRLDKDCLNKPSLFSIEILIDSVLYSYTIEVYRSKIIKEKLSFYPKGARVKIFERNNQDIIKGNGYEGIFETIKQRTTENQLFLSKAASENVEIAKTVYRDISWLFTLTTDILHSANFNKNFASMLFKEVISDDKLLALSKSLVQKLDTQVVGFEEKEGKIKTFHKNKQSEEVEFDLEDESSGTQRIISFIPLLLIALKYGQTMIVDEFERSLHPDIAQYFLSLFNDSEVNKNGAQFIFATHDISLLNTDNNLRRDQVYLVEKNQKGETETYSISDIKGIREGNYEKWYSEGRLGAIPNIAKETFKNELLLYINSL